MTQQADRHRSSEQATVDPLLLLFADRANRRGLEVEITLQVGDLLVSGFVTSLAKYCDKLEGQMSEGLAQIDPSAGPAPTPADGPASDRSAAASSEFIHLRDACISNLRQGPVIRVPAWRGRLFSVDAFALGVPEHLKADSQVPEGHGH